MLEPDKESSFIDYYKVIGCHPSSTPEQINTEYKIRALQCHPDKNRNNEDATKTFAHLQIAKDVLTDPQERKDYDLWRNSGLGLSYNKWKTMRNSMKMSMHWASTVSPERITESQDSVQRKVFSDNGTVTDVREKMRRKFRNYEI